MTAIAGYGGSFKNGSNTVAEIGEWNLNVDATILDTTKLGDSWKDNIVGLKSWNGKATGRWDMTDTNGQVAMQTALLNGTSITVNCYTSGTHFYSGSVWIKAIAIKDAVAAAVDIEFTFEGNGALTFT